MKCLISLINKEGIIVLTEEGKKGIIPYKEAGDLNSYFIGQMLELEPTNREHNGKQVLILKNIEKKLSFEDMMQKYLKESNEESLEYFKKKPKKKRR